MRLSRHIPFTNDQVTHRVVLVLILIVLGVFFLLAKIYSIVHGAVKVESELKSLAMESHSDSSKDSGVEPYEVFIELGTKGERLMNEEQVTGPWVEALMQIKSRAGTGKVRVTLSCHEQTPYHQVLEVLDALNVAKLDDVTLTVGEETF
jgi:biopolymer transport protein ExbD